MRIPLFTATALLALACNVTATNMIIGPSQYFSPADSPFFAGIQAGTIHLEDFEDHVLNMLFVIVNDFNNDSTN